MEWLKTALMVVQVCSALAIILLVLLQQGKGADMGAAFGSGSSGSIFGATGSSNFLSRTTGILAAVFFLSTLSISYLGTDHSKDAGVLSKPASGVPTDRTTDALPSPVKEVAPPSGSTVPK